MNYINRARKFNTKKRLGQNFLIDSSIIDYIVNESNIDNETYVLEIGPGIGFLTEKLVLKAKSVTSVEIDKDAFDVLKKLNANNFKIINSDILKINLYEIFDFENKIKIIGNIPYYITTPIILHLLGEIDDLENKNRSLISEIYLMVQYEVGKRIVANENSKNKEYGLLSILSQFFCDVEMLEKVNARSFYPSPKVDSSIVKFKVNNEPKIKVKDYSFLKKIIHGAFSQRRKNIKNSLLNSGFKINEILYALKELNLNENIRAEKLSIEIFGKLSDSILEYRENN